MEYLLVTLLLLLISAFEALSEVSSFAISKLRLHYLVEKKHPSALRIARILQEPEAFVSSVLIANTVATMLMPVFMALFIFNIYGHDSGWMLTGGTALIVGVDLIFCEIMPKIIGSQYPERCAFFVARLLYGQMVILKPFTWLIKRITDIFFWLLGIRIEPKLPQMSREELRHMVHLSEATGHLHPEEKKMLYAVFSFHDKRVHEVMLPREKIIALDVQKPQQEALYSANEQGYTRLPVYQGTLDNILGIVHSKDLLNVFLHKDLFILQDLLRPPHFVSETQKIFDLLRFFQQNHLHLALVKNDKGDVVGLVTMEDILEEIVGEIEDEYDVEVTP